MQLCVQVEGLLEDKLASGTQANDEDIYGSMSELLDDVMDRERQINEESTQATIRPGATNVAGAIGGNSMQSSLCMFDYLCSTIALYKVYHLKLPSSIVSIVCLCL